MSGTKYSYAVEVENDGGWFGMIAGFPSPEQYEAAAARALVTAADLRERAVKREARRAARRTS